MKFELNKEKRQNEILRVCEGKPVQVGVKLPIRSDERFEVYKIPVKFLIYNHLNDRFASKSKEYFHKNGVELSNGNNDSLELIEKFIWDSNVGSNQATMKDIVKKGQEKFGVITRDGRIIDGNRRATIIRKIFYSDEKKFPHVNKERFRYFEAVVLPDDIDDEEMMILETQIQMGEDDKVEYNAIEKYLKIDKLYDNGLDYAEISNMISSMKTAKDVEKKHQTYKIMEEYLDYIEAPYSFSLISKFEDHFLGINAVMESYKKGNYNVDWAPTEADMFELKIICFDYIRKGHEGKDFRFILGNSKGGKSIFSKKDVWTKFQAKTELISEVADKKIKHKTDTETLTIEQRENYWKNEVKRGMDRTIILGKEAMNNHLEKDRPKVLVEGALDKIALINVDLLIENYDIEGDKEVYETIKSIEFLAKEIKERIINDVFKKIK